MKSYLAALVCAMSLLACSTRKPENTSHEQAPSARSALPSTDAGQPDGGPVPARFTECSSRRASGQEPRSAIPLLPSSQLARVFEAAKRGEIERIRVRAHHPMLMCDWPNFSITSFAHETYGAAQIIDGGGMFYAIFPEPLLDANKYRSLGAFGEAEHELTGYYSGRLVDAFAWSRVQYGVPLRESCEDRSDMDTKYPEFCVESWCVRTNPAAAKWKDPRSRDEYGRAYAKALQDARKDGVTFCPDAPQGADAAGSCPKYEWGRKGRGRSSHVDNHPREFAELLSALKRAVAANDKEAVLRLLHLRSLGVTREEFLRRYDEVMTPCVREAIRCATIDEVAEDYLGAWVGHDTLLVNEMEEGVFLVTGFPNEGICRPKRGQGP